MQVAKWGNSLAVRIPADVARALNIKEGDDLDVSAEDGKLKITPKPVDRESVFARMRALSKPLPKGWKFDREEANAR
ncbi:AbrB/MazE/SpoVT family DNA-binding domain-containing protein [Sphingobium boeckii]|uniref:Antitoxin MazE n=1 Tax=Sphingobium boeckii TaxID=1082345 RepID=A0A7W9EEU7_9SPHN|nr:AbrB/MazE/SpoVT family DNA-binding domain-containing protein [Sphingobium boeckii]MBB5686552.1 antitoxin MazE [Sphingobium boeckii]